MAIAWLTLAAAACSPNPATGARDFSLMTEGQEIALGRQSDVRIRREMGVYDDPALQSLVSSIGMRMAQVSERPHLPWHFAVVDSPAVNAFALPGGYIYITRGILAFFGSEAELAGVLGHEVGHVAARHSAQQYSRSAGAQLALLLAAIFVPEARPFGQLAESGLGLLFLKYGRDDELQADGLGVRYSARSGWDPRAVPDMLSSLDRIDSAHDLDVPNWLATHPAPEARIAKVRSAVEEARRSTLDATAGQDRHVFLKKIDGLVYGDHPDEGIVQNGRFVHRALRFSVTIPPGWEVSNSPTQMIAKESGRDVVLLLQLVERSRGSDDIEDMALRFMRGRAWTC